MEDYFEITYVSKSGSSLFDGITFFLSWEDTDELKEQVKEMNKIAKKALGKCYTDFDDSDLDEDEIKILEG